MGAPGCTVWADQESSWRKQPARGQNAGVGSISTRRNRGEASTWRRQAELARRWACGVWAECGACVGAHRVPRLRRPALRLTHWLWSWRNRRRSRMGSAHSVLSSRAQAPAVKAGRGLTRESDAHTLGHAPPPWSVRSCRAFTAAPSVAAWQQRAEQTEASGEVQGVLGKAAFPQPCPGAGARLGLEERPEEVSGSLTPGCLGPLCRRSEWSAAVGSPRGPEHGDALVI